MIIMMYHSKSATFTNGLIASPSSSRLCAHRPCPNLAPRRAFPPWEAASVLPGHQGAVELLAHHPSWQENVNCCFLRCVMCCGARGYACSVCPAVQAKQLVLLLKSCWVFVLFFFPLSMGRPFLSKLNL